MVTQARSQVALCIHRLETEGWTVVHRCLSTRFLRNLARRSGRRPPLQAAREACEGLPLRIIRGLIGDPILSSIGYVEHCEAPAWHRGRDDTLASGAPVSFVPGFDLVLPVSPQGAEVDIASGSFRLSAQQAHPSEQLVAPLHVPAESLAILDIRMLRRFRLRPKNRIFTFSVVRPWLCPEIDLEPLLPSDLPRRTARFFGLTSRPGRDIRAWLLRSHRTRPEEPSDSLGRTH